MNFTGMAFVYKKVVYLSVIFCLLDILLKLFTVLCVTSWLSKQKHFDINIKGNKIFLADYFINM